MYNIACKLTCSIESSVHVRHRGRLHYARGIWKHSYIITTVMPTVYTNPSWKRSSSKTTFKPEAFINTSFPFYCGRKTFWKWSFSKTMTSRWPCDFPARDFLKHKSKWPVIDAFSNFPWVLWTGPKMRYATFSVQSWPTYNWQVVILINHPASTDNLNGTLRCVLGQDALLSQRLSPPRCTNGYRRIQRWG